MCTRLSLCVVSLSSFLPPPPLVQKPAAAASKPSGGPGASTAAKSRLAAIKAAMKAKQQAAAAEKAAQAAGSAVDDPVPQDPQGQDSDQAQTQAPETVVFHGGFFQVESPAKLGEKEVLTYILSSVSAHVLKLMKIFLFCCSARHNEEVVPSDWCCAATALPLLRLQTLHPCQDTALQRSLPPSPPSPHAHARPPHPCAHPRLPQIHLGLHPAAPTIPSDPGLQCLSLLHAGHRGSGGPRQPIRDRLRAGWGRY